MMTPCVLVEFVNICTNMNISLILDSIKVNLVFFKKNYLFKKYFS